MQTLARLFDYARPYRRDAQLASLHSMLNKFFDVLPEVLIGVAVDVVAQGRTTLLAAHRLSTVRNADIIHVMEQGHIIESGTHAQLLATNGVYASLWRLQTGERIG